MDYTMSDYYEVLQYLRETKVDREYPYEYKELTNLESNNALELSTEHISNHDSSIHLTNVQNDDTLLIKLDKPRSYQEINTFELNIYTNSAFNSSDIQVSLSDSPIGIPVKITLQPVTEENFSTQTIVNIEFQVDDRTTKILKKNRRVPAIQSILITFKKSLGDVYISETVFRTTNCHITLESLDYNIRAGENYVETQLYLADRTDIPTTLTYLNYKAAAAYAWLTWWEDEGKAMNDGTVNGENYAARLFEQINSAIAKYIEAHPITLSDEINTDVIGWSEYEKVPYIKGPMRPPNSLMDRLRR